MNTEQYNFENTKDAISDITLSPQELIDEVKVFHDLLNGAIEATILSGRAMVSQKLDEEKTKIQRDKILETITAQKANELEKKRRAKVSLLNTYLTSKDAFVNYVFDKNNDVDKMIESLTSIEELLPLAGRLFKLTNIKNEVLNFILNFANDIDAKEFLNKNWQEINSILIYLLKIDAASAQTPALNQDEDINPEELAASEIAATINAGEAINKLFKDKSYEKSALLADDESGDNKPGKPSSGASIRSGMSTYDSYTGVVNKSFNFFGRKVDNLQQQINILNKTVDDLNKKDITSYYIPFSIVPNQNNVVQVLNKDGKLTFNIDQKPFAGLINVASQVIVKISNDMNKVIESFGISGSTIERLEAERYSNAMRLDDLMLSMKLRDDLVLDKVAKLKLENNIEIPLYKVEPILFRTVLKRPDSRLREEISKVLRMIAFPAIDSENALYSYIKKVADNRSNDPEFIDAVTRQVTSRANYALNDKILDFFTSLDQNNFCQTLVRSFRLEIIVRAAVSAEKQSSVKGWTYVTCPTCSKSIYYSQYLSRDFDKEQFNKEKEDDFFDAVYVPIRQDYTPITESDLAYYDDGTEKVYNISGKNYTWLQVKNMITPQSPADRDQPHTDEEHREGLLLRSLILDQAKAIKISSSYNYSKAKTKCPFGVLPKSIREARKNLKSNDEKSSKSKDAKSGKSLELAVQNFSCGMSFDFDQLKNAKEPLMPHEVNIAPIKEGVNPREELKASVDYLVNNGILEEYHREDFEAELNRRMSGGWKNSNKVFPCPCKYDATSKNNDLKNFKMIAFPITGVVSSSLHSSEYEPPTDPYGNKLNIEEGTASYAVCGANVSLSSFSRDPSDPNSIQGLLRQYYQAYANDKNSNKIYDLINALVMYGVDFNDILPYMQYLSDFLMKVSSKKISPIDNSALRELVKFATISLYKKPQGSKSKETALEILKDLKLICSNGHSFTIGSSVNFGKSHHAVDFTYNDQNKKKIQNSRILELSGAENLRATIELSLKNQRQRFISEITDAQSVMYTNIKNWNGDFNNLGKCYFEYNGSKYIFNDINKDLAWGYFKGNSFYTQELKETRDKNTAVVLGQKQMVAREKIGADGHLESIIDTISADESKEIESIADERDFSILDSDSDEESLSEDGINKYKEEIAARNTLYNTAPALVNRYHSNVVIILKSALSMIKDFTEVATNLDVYGTLKSSPVAFISFESEKKDFENKISSAAKKLVLYAESNLDAGMNLDENDLDLFMSEFNYNIENDYYNYMMVQDLRLHDVFGKSISMFSEKNIYVNISEAIIKSARSVFSKDRATKYRNDIFKNISNEIFDDASVKNIKNNFEKSGAKEDVDSAISILRNIVEDLRIKGDKKGIKTKKDVVAPEIENLGISNLRAAEYLARIYSMSSALYMADSLAMLFKKYIITGSENYIGYDLITDDAVPTSRDHIISKDTRDINPFIADHLLLMPNMLKEESVIQLLREFEKSSDFKDYLYKYKSTLDMMIDDYKQMLSGMKTVVSSNKYLNDSLEIIRSFILKKVELSSYSDEAKKIATNLVSNCMVAPPVTTIDLMPGSKYDKFYQNVDTFRKLPMFRAYVVKGSVDSSIVYCISESGNKFCNFGDINIVSEKGFAIVLTRDTKFGSSGEDLTSSITDKVLIQNGWHLYKVRSKGLAFKDELVSMFYHPYTFAIDKDGNHSIPSVSSNAFYNSVSNINTSSGFMIGKFISNENENSSKSYPPSNDYDHVSDTPGLIVPIDYRLSDGGFDSGFRQDHSRVFPLFNARVPVLIPMEGGDGITIDVSDFLARDPQDLAKKYLNDIYDTYIDYQKKSSSFGVANLADLAETNTEEDWALKNQMKTQLVGDYSTNTTRKSRRSESARIQSKKNALKREYKERIAEIYSKYKSLPLLVHALRCTSLTPKSMSNNIREARSAYVPMIDYVTINKILSIKGFSSEFGGHDFWSPDDDNAKNTTVGAVRKMLIDMNNLEDLAREINNEVRNFSCILTIGENKIRISNGFITLNINAYDLLSPYGDDMTAESSIGLYVKIYSAADKAIRSLVDSKKIKEYTEENLYQLTYALSTFLVGTPIKRDWKPGGMVGFYNKESAADAYKSFDRLKNKNYPTWRYSVGGFYNILSELSEAGGLPPARFSIISDIFPFDGGKSKRATEMKRIQDELDSTILGQYNIHGSAVYYGRPASTELHISRENLPKGISSKDQAEKNKAISDRKKNLENVIDTGSINLGHAAVNAATDYVLKYIVNARNIFEEEIDEITNRNVKKASYRKFLSRREQRLSAPISRPISKAASKISKMANEDFIASDYYLRNISLAAIAALVSQIART